MVFTIIPASNSKHKPWYDVKRRNGGHGTKAISGKQSPNTKATAAPDGGGLVNANDHYTFAQPYYPYYGNYYRGSTKTHLNQYQPQSQPLRTSTSSFVQKRGGTSQFSPSQLNVNSVPSGTTIDDMVLPSNGMANGKQRKSRQRKNSSLLDQNNHHNNNNNNEEEEDEQGDHNHQQTGSSPTPSSITIITGSNNEERFVVTTTNPMVSNFNSSSTLKDTKYLPNLEKRSSSSSPLLLFQQCLCASVLKLLIILIFVGIGFMFGFTVAKYMFLPACDHPPCSSASSSNTFSSTSPKSNHNKHQLFNVNRTSSFITKIISNESEPYSTTSTSTITSLILNSNSTEVSTTTIESSSLSSTTTTTIINDTMSPLPEISTTTESKFVSEKIISETNLTTITPVNTDSNVDVETTTLVPTTTSFDFNFNDYVSDIFPNNSTVPLTDDELLISIRIPMSSNQVINETAPNSTHQSTSTNIIDPPVSTMASTTTSSLTMNDLIDKPSSSSSFINSSTIATESTTNIVPTIVKVISNVTNDYDDESSSVLSSTTMATIELPINTRSIGSDDDDDDVVDVDASNSSNVGTVTTIAINTNKTESIATTTNQSIVVVGNSSKSMTLTDNDHNNVETIADGGIHASNGSATSTTSISTSKVLLVDKKESDSSGTNETYVTAKPIEVSERTNSNGTIINDEQQHDSSFKSEGNDRLTTTVATFVVDQLLSNITLVSVGKQVHDTPLQHSNDLAIDASSPANSTVVIIEPKTIVEKEDTTFNSSVELNQNNRTGYERNLSHSEVDNSTNQNDLVNGTAKNERLSHSVSLTLLDGSNVQDFCLDTQFRCPEANTTKKLDDSSIICLDNDHLCDGIIDCPLDSFDELNCSETKCQQNYMCGNLNHTDLMTASSAPNGNWTNGTLPNLNETVPIVELTKCIPRRLYCDGIWDCPDGSDEIDCQITKCRPNEIRCRDGSACITGKQACDGVYNCRDHSDEIGCVSKSSCDSSGGLYCEIGLCIERSFRCDGYQDCPNGTDELNCLTAETCASLENKFYCQSGECIDLAKRCDGHQDCLDYSDEDSCIENDSEEIVHLFNAKSGYWSLYCVPDPSNFNSSDADNLCSSMGRSRSMNYSFIEVGKLLGDSTWGSIQMDRSSNIIPWQYSQNITHSKECASNSTIAIQCSKFDCNRIEPIEPIITNHNVTNTTTQGGSIEPNLTPVEAPEPLYVMAKNSSLNSTRCVAYSVALKWLIASGQCIKNFQSLSIKDLLISNSNNSWSMPIQQVRIHPHYSLFRTIRYPDYDMALLETELPLPKSIISTSAICLPSSKLDPEITCFLGDYGSGDTAFEVVETSFCNSSRQFDGSMTTRTICAARTGLPDADSPSPCLPPYLPLLCLTSKSEWYLSGFISYQRGCESIGSEFPSFLGYYKHPTIFSNLFAMREFVEHTLGIGTYHKERPKLKTTSVSIVNQSIDRNSTLINAVSPSTITSELSITVTPPPINNLRAVYLRKDELEKEIGPIESAIRNQTFEDMNRWQKSLNLSPNETVKILYRNETPIIEPIQNVTLTPIQPEVTTQIQLLPESQLPVKEVVNEQQIDNATISINNSTVDMLKEEVIIESSNKTETLSVDVNIAEPTTATTISTNSTQYNSTISSIGSN